MTSSPAHPRRLFTGAGYAGFKLVVYLLLGANTALFAIRGTAAEGLDATAWLTLVLLFELETAHAARLASRRALIAVHAVRFTAAVAVVAAAIGYVGENDWLDATNAWLWIAVVVVLEIKVRFGRDGGQRPDASDAIAAVLYVALAALVGAWAWRGAWFDAYDAAIWLLAFFTIEMNVRRQR